MNVVPFAELTLTSLDGRSTLMHEIVKRTTLLIFLRHLA